MFPVSKFFPTIVVSRSVSKYLLVVLQCMYFEAVSYFLGANDNSEPGNDSHVPMEEFAENMLSIGNFFIERGLSASKIIMTGPPGFHGPAWEERCKELGMVVGKKTNEGAAEYSLLVTEVSKHLGCRNIALHAKMMQEQNWHKMLIDGLHFGPQGAQFYFELLKPHLEHLTYDIPTMLPLWRDYDPQDHENCKPLSETVHDWMQKNPYFVR